MQLTVFALHRQKNQCGQLLSKGWRSPHFFLLALAFVLTIPGYWGNFCWAKPCERTLSFSSDYSVGNFMALENPPEVFGTCKGTPLAEARGVVRLPYGKLIKFSPNGTFYQHPDCLLKLPPDAFDFVELAYLSMADEEDTFCDRAIPFLRHITFLKGIDLDKSDASDAGLSQLSAMPELRSITACDSKVTGRCLPHLAGCKKLVAFRLANVAVDNESLSWLKSFPRLERLGLVRVGISPRGLEHVSRCTTIRTLDLDYNRNIDDRAVPFLLRLPRLTTLWIGGTGISVKGVEQLAQHGVINIKLPRPFSSYSIVEQRRIRKAFPGTSFGEKERRPSIDPFTDKMFSPITR
ncbi:MAG: hypothetical protein JST01_14955 [Cyanobacteria bacterium SZAS TMP-1]|nr:hypothetical protein [Cyanobacteria bacterium SZAS TMP-1]